MLVNPSTRWEEGGQGGGSRGELASVSVLWWSWWCGGGGGGGLEVEEWRWWRWCTHTNIPLQPGWASQCCPKDPQLQPARASGLAAYSVPETAETEEQQQPAWLSNNISQAGSSSVASSVASLHWPMQGRSSTLKYRELNSTHDFKLKINALQILPTFLLKLSHSTNSTVYSLQNWRRDREKTEPGLWPGPVSSNVKSGLAVVLLSR